jgi:hypothetical protein
METDGGEPGATNLVTARMLFSGLQAKPPPLQQPGPRHTIDAILGLSSRPSEPGGAESSGE